MSIVSLLLTATAYIAIVNDIERSAVELEAAGRQMQVSQSSPHFVLWLIFISINQLLSTRDLCFEIRR